MTRENKLLLACIAFVVIVALGLALLGGSYGGFKG